MPHDERAKLTPVFSVLETAVKTWWKNLKKIILIYFWGLLFTLAPLAVIAIVLSLGLMNGLSVSPFWLIVGSFLCLWAALFVVYFLIRIYLSLFLLIKNNYDGSERKIYQESANYFWSYLSLEILTTILMTLWFLALFIPAIIFSVFYVFTMYAFFFEDKKSMDAVRRSCQLVKDYWWAVLGRIVVIIVAIIAFISLISWPLAYFSDSFAGQLWGVLIQIISLLVSPIVMIFIYRVYRDLVKIKG